MYELVNSCCHMILAFQSWWMMGWGGRLERVEWGGIIMDKVISQGN